MLDEHGEVVWRGRFSTWSETERESATGFQIVQQNAGPVSGQRNCIGCEDSSS
ncbi:hypothetical protein [Erwinia sp. CGal63]|uniref:hypothetical protein n=1 Tax=Erwinia sp. CGal63 TaxID=2919889 RepID=UPI00300B51AE